MNVANSYILDPKLADDLKDAAASGHTVSIRIDDHIYRLSISPAPGIGASDLWKDYDPERVRAAVCRSAALPSRADPAELDPLIAEIRAQRDQASDRPDS